MAVGSSTVREGRRKYRSDRGGRPRSRNGGSASGLAVHKPSSPIARSQVVGAPLARGLYAQAGPPWLPLLRAGGVQPVWRGDSREIAFVGPDDVDAVAVTAAGTSFTSGRTGKPTPRGGCGAGVLRRVSSGAAWRSLDWSSIRRSTRLVQESTCRSTDSYGPHRQVWSTHGHGFTTRSPTRIGRIRSKSASLETRVRPRSLHDAASSVSLARERFPRTASAPSRAARAARIRPLSLNAAADGVTMRLRRSNGVKYSRWTTARPCEPEPGPEFLDDDRGRKVVTALAAGRRRGHAATSSLDASMKILVSSPDSAGSALFEDIVDRPALRMAAMPRVNSCWKRHQIERQVDGFSVRGRLQGPPVGVRLALVDDHVLADHRSRRLVDRFGRVAVAGIGSPLVCMNSVAICMRGARRAQARPRPWTDGTTALVMELVEATLTEPDRADLKPR